MDIKYMDGKIMNMDGKIHKQKGCGRGWIKNVKRT